MADGKQSEYLSPGLVQHLHLGQLPSPVAGSNQAEYDGGDHHVVEVVLDEVESLAGRQSGAVEVEAVDEDDDCGLEAGGRGEDSPDGLHPLAVVEDALVREWQLGYVGRNAGLPHVARGGGVSIRFVVLEIYLESCSSWFVVLEILLIHTEMKRNLFS